MKMKSIRRTVVQEHDHGLWIWLLDSDGLPLGDADGNTMNVPGKRVDPEAVKKITQAARYYGFPEGHPFFLQGRRRVSDEEFEEQKAREALGLVPDPLDLGAIKDELRDKKLNG